VRAHDHGYRKAAMVPCQGCGGLIRKENSTGRCRPCWDAYRAPPACSAELWQRAETAVKLIRDGEDGALMLAATVWPELETPVG